MVRLYWDRVFFGLMKKAHYQKDEGMLSILRTINEAPRSVQDDLIKRYVKKCKEKHSIAFMQWRYYYCREVSNQEELDEIIGDRIEFMKKALKRRKNFLLSQETLAKVDLPILNEDIYFDKKNWAYHINAFTSIGWPDPFPSPMQ